MISLTRDLLVRLARLARGEDAARWRTKSEGWGRAGALAAPWVARERRVITSIDPPVVWRTPQQQTILLRCQLIVAPGAGAQSGIFRWEVKAGVGAGESTYIFDAVALQQVSLPAEALRISLFADQVNDAPIDAAALTAHFSVSICDGTNATSSARYTEFFNINAGSGAYDVSIPNGATAFRVAGLPGGVADPFDAAIAYGLRQAGGLFFDWFTGPEMLTVHVSDQFVPLAGTCDALRVTHGAVGAFGAIVWQLEL